MKSRKVLNYQQLILECVEQLGRMFKVYIPPLVLFSASFPLSYSLSNVLYGMQSCSLRWRQSRKGLKTWFLVTTWKEIKIIRICSSTWLEPAFMSVKMKEEGQWLQKWLNKEDFVSKLVKIWALRSNSFWRGNCGCFLHFSFIYRYRLLLRMFAQHWRNCINSIIWSNALVSSLSPHFPAFLSCYLVKVQTYPLIFPTPKETRHSVICSFSGVVFWFPFYSHLADT